MTTIDVDFKGNESDLVDSFNRVGQASKEMGDAVDDSGSRMRDSSEAFDALSERSDTAETRFTGFYDTLGGTKDALAAFSDESLSTSDKLIALGQAGADLAGGFTGFVIPAVQSLWTKLAQTRLATIAQTVAQGALNIVTNAGAVAMRLLNAAFKANPILFVVGLVLLLVGVFKTLWDRSAGFRNFFIGMWKAIQTVAGGAARFVQAVWRGIPGFFRGIVNGIKSVFSGIGDFIKNVFKGAINFVIDIINGAISLINGLISGYNAVPIAPDIPLIPKIPRLHTGGTVPGRPGDEVLTILQAGEKVSANGQGGSSGTLRVMPGADKGVAELINYLIRKKYIQLV